jgi:hypothetical protein
MTYPQILPNHLEKQLCFAMIALVFSPMPHTKSIGWQIYL